MNTKDQIVNYKEKDKKYIWHPFCQLQDWVLDEDITIIERGEEEYLIDIEGKRYLDATSSVWVNIWGHNNKKINEAIIKQLNKIAHTTFLGATHIPGIELAELLIKMTKKELTKVFFSDNGSCAVEIALKLAFQYWRNIGIENKTKFISFKNAYHGDTLGTVMVGGIELFHKIYTSLTKPVYYADYPYCYRCSLDLEPKTCNLACLKTTETILQNHHQEIAALIIEPLVQCAGGIIISPPGFLKEVERLCRKYNILLIADEVAVGFGRTGKLFAIEHEGVTPDFLCLAKGITGGYLPLAATLTTDKIYSAFLGGREKTFYHGHSYTANPLACAAALANIKLFEEKKILDSLSEKINLLKQSLKKISCLLHVGDIRQIGLIAGIELVKDKKTKEPYLWHEKIGQKVAKHAKKLGVLLRPLGNVIVLMPPLTITEEQIKYLEEVVYISIKNATE